MQWFYALNGERLGPVTPEQLATLVAHGTVTSETLVWREGFANWEPWGSVAAANPLPTPAGDAPAPEAYAPVGEASDSEGWGIDEFTEKLYTNGYSTSVGGALSRAWANYKSFFGLAFGACLVVVLISMVAGFLPVIGLLSGILITPHLQAGAAWLFLKRARGETVEFGDVFAGFSRCYGKLALVGLIQFGIALSFGIAVAIVFAAVGVQLDGTSGSPPDLPPALAIGLMIGFLLVMFVAIWLTARFLLTYIAAVDMTGSAVDAYRMSWRITNGRFWTVFGLMLIMFLLAIAGSLLLFIGLLFVIPLFAGIVAQLYHDAQESAAGRPPE